MEVLDLLSFPYGKAATLKNKMHALKTNVCTGDKSIQKFYSLLNYVLLISAQSVTGSISVNDFNNANLG